MRLLPTGAILACSVAVGSHGLFCERWWFNSADARHVDYIGIMSKLATVFGFQRRDCDRLTL